MKKIFLTLTDSILFIPIGISQDLPSYVPSDGLVAYYAFNGNANDESGNGNHGTVNAISNSVFWSSSEDDSENAWRRILHWGTQSFSKSSSKIKKTVSRLGLSRIKL